MKTSELVKGQLYINDETGYIGYYVGIDKNEMLLHVYYTFANSPNSMACIYLVDVDIINMRPAYLKHKYYGKHVMVWDSGEIKQKQKRILIDEITSSGCRVVRKKYEINYNNNESFYVDVFEHWEPIDEKETITIEVTPEQKKKIMEMLK